MAMNNFNWGSGGGMPSFQQFQNWGQQFGNQGGNQNNYQVGQNRPIDSNAGLRDPNANYTPVNPYMAEQSNRNAWTGNDWTSNRGTPVDTSQGYSRPQGDPSRFSGGVPTGNQGGMGRTGMFTGANRPPQYSPAPQEGPYQMPMNRPQISSANGMMMNPPGGVGPGPMMSGNPNATDSTNGGRSFAFGQQQYNGPAIGQMQRPPQSAFGQQNPTQYVGPFNQLGRNNPGMVNPYRNQTPYGAQYSR